MVSRKSLCIEELGANEICAKKQLGNQFHSFRQRLREINPLEVFARDASYLIVIATPLAKTSVESKTTAKVLVSACPFLDCAIEDDNSESARCRSSIGRRDTKVHGRVITRLVVCMVQAKIQFQIAISREENCAVAKRIVVVGLLRGPRVSGDADFVAKLGPVWQRERRRAVS